MTEIVSQVQRVSQLISEISSASREQSTGINQVGEAVTQLDQVTQQNAALVEESAAAADSLKHQAAALARVVSAFTLPETIDMGLISDSGAFASNDASADRPSPNRISNLQRTPIPAKAKSSPMSASRVSGRSAAVAKTGTDDWSEF